MMAWRFFLRDFRSTSWRTLLLALAVAVAALTAVGLLTTRMERLLGREANAVLAADAVFSADHPIPESTLSLARGLQIATTTTFLSMASFGERAQLASVKAVGAAYPLRGKLVLKSNAQGARAPQPGSAYVDERLALTLGAKVGDEIGLGEITLRIAALIEREPDSGFDFSGLQPRLMMNEADLERAALIGFGSRVRYKLLVAGSDEEVDRWLADVQPILTRGERIESARENRPELNSALLRAERFLRLSTLLAGALSSIAILLAARRHVARYLDTVAILRTLGISRLRLRAILLGQLALLGLLAALLGGLAGWAAESLLIASVRAQLPDVLPQADWRVWPVAATLGLGLLLGGAGPLLLSLADTPPMRVLRHDLTPPARVWLEWGVLALVLSGVFYLVAEEIRLAAWLGGGLLATVVLAAGGGLGLILLLRRVVTQGALGLALRQLLARRWLSAVQLGALALGLLGLWLITVVERDLMEAWQRRIPADAPNHFAINIQPHQIDAFLARFAANGLPAPAVQPMIRGRWMKHNGIDVDLDRYDDDRARRLAEREFNLSTLTAARADNRIIAGRAIGANEAGFSVEEGLAKSLNIRIGDILTFDIAGTAISAPVINLREVGWDSFRVNFFVEASPRLLADFPASRITSFYLPPKQKTLVPDLVRALPNVTLIDVGAVLNEVRRVLELSAAALRLVFGFCIVAGLTVLLAALDTTEAERQREAAILRALGATARRLRRIWFMEAMLTGAAAGLVAGLLASATGWALGRQVLDLPVSFNFGLPLLSLLTGCVLTVLVAWRRLSRLARTSPAQLLRDAA